ncbi:dihydrofolate reductase family protein [Microbacterium sp.]|uniref:dihydrofolate reductase family protein n=1 Tax=Microbacterium sp. TaxID=51671 RepID=UPI002736E42B|nr:dihydrofolate reductase family protein [Microbacterium sp.]MDP3949260.1 dihydrofolate reductase family protein [Microbacterium sp.]
MSFVFSDITISIDGFASGLGQTAEKPFGDSPAQELHRWMFEDAEENAAEIKAVAAADAFVMGRNMFGPDRGEFDLHWMGWWGPNPPYHGPVFVLSHHKREPLAMEGGTTFTFVNDGIEAALEQATAAAGADGRVSIAGGAATVNQYLKAGLINELRTHIAPVILGAGERLLLDVPARTVSIVSARGSALATHISYRIG